MEEDRSNEVKQWLLPVLFAGLITFGLLTLFALSLGNKPTPATASATSLNSPGDLTAPIGNSKSGESAVRQRLAPALDATLSVDALRAACVKEARSGPARQDPESACERFAKASRAQLPAPSPTAEWPETQIAPEMPNRSKQQGWDEFKVPVRNCRAQFGYGTIKERQCRAHEAERLRLACRDISNKADAARAITEIQHYRKLSRSYCHASSSYRVIN